MRAVVIAANPRRLTRHNLLRFSAVFTRIHHANNIVASRAFSADSRGDQRILGLIFAFVYVETPVPR